MKKLSRYLGRRSEQRLTGGESKNSDQAWVTWDKRLTVIAAALAIGTAGAAGVVWIHDTIWKTPGIVLRHRTWTPSDGWDVFDVSFSVVNPTAEPIFLNKLELLEGPLTVGVGGLPPIAAVMVSELHDQVQITDLTVGTGEQIVKVPIPPVSTSSRDIHFNDEDSYIRHQIFAGARMRLEANDQLDYHLVVRVIRPPALHPEKLNEPQIPVKIFIQWEPAEGTPRMIRFIDSLVYRNDK